MDPKDMLNDPEKIKDMIAMLQALLPKTEDAVTSNKTKKTKQLKASPASQLLQKPKRVNLPIAPISFWRCKKCICIKTILS